MRISFDDYLYRCHPFGRLMGGAFIGLTPNQDKLFTDLTLRHQNPTGKPLTPGQQVTLGELMVKANTKPVLSVGAKSFLHLIHKQEIFGMNKDISSKYLDKGLQVESQGISLYSEVTGKFFAKNSERKSNKYFTGEADNTQERIRDIKSSWDFETFPLHDKALNNEAYVWQMQLYMDLYEKDSAELIYVLVDTPEMLIEDEIVRTGRKLGLIDMPEELEAEIRHNLTYQHIPKELRVRSFYIKRDKQKIAAARKYALMGRKYLNQLSEEMAERLHLLQKLA